MEKRKIMQILLNGETKICEAGLSIRQLIENLSLDLRKVAIEVNLAIIPRSHYDTTILQAEDRVEIVRFIGGG